MTRRLVAIGGLVLLVLVLGVLLNSCVKNSRIGGLRDYSDAVTRLGTESRENVSQAFNVLTNASGSEALEQSQKLGDLAADADRFTQRARDLDTPGGLEVATENAATALSLRATAVRRIGDLIGKARGTSASEQETATTSIAGEMTALLASDVLWKSRVTPFIIDKFKDYDRPSDGVESSQSLSDLSWTNTQTVANRIGGVAPEDAQDDTTQPLAPGPHGHELTGVAINGTDLEATGATRVENPSGTSFVVTIENQGASDEENVTVEISGKSPATGRSLFDQTKKVTLSAKGTSTPVTINVSTRVTSSVVVTAEVKKVRGEENTTNNRKTYNVIFSG